MHRKNPQAGSELNKYLLAFRSGFRIEDAAAATASAAWVALVTTTKDKELVSQGLLDAATELWKQER